MWLYFFDNFLSPIFLSLFSPHYTVSVSLSLWLTLSPRESREVLLLNLKLGGGLCHRFTHHPNWNMYSQIPHKYQSQESKFSNFIEMQTCGVTTFWVEPVFIETLQLSQNLCSIKFIHHFLIWILNKNHLYTNYIFNLCKIQ